MEVLPRGASFSNIGLTMHEALKEDSKKLDQESICKVPSEDREISRILMEPWKTDSRSRGMEFIQQLHIEETISPQGLSSLNALLTGSRQSTIQNDASKLLLNPNPEISKTSEENGMFIFNEEKAVSTPMADPNMNASPGLITDMLLRNYFGGSNINFNNTSN